MTSTTARGDLAELELSTALARAGKVILRPLSNGLRYDIAIANDDGTYVRVQCKTGVLRNGRIEFRVCSADRRRPGGIPYHGQVDAFGVFCPQNGRAYLVPMAAVADCGIVASLRVEPAKNAQVKGVREAAGYEIAPTPPRGRGAPTR